MEVFTPHATVWADTEHVVRDYISHLVWESFRIPLNKLEDVTKEKDIWATDLDLDRQQRMAGWMDNLELHTTPLFTYCIHSGGAASEETAVSASCWITVWFIFWF